MIQCITYRVSHEVSSKTIWSPASFFLAGVSFNIYFMNHVKPEQILTTGTSLKKNGRPNRSVRITWCHHSDHHFAAEKLQSFGDKGQPNGEGSSEKEVFFHCGHPP